MTRFACTETIAREYGFVKDGKVCVRSFLRWVKEQKGFPRPKRRHHLWWDTKAIDQYLDKVNNTQPQSDNDDDIIFGRLNGKHSREIPA